MFPIIPVFLAGASVWGASALVKDFLALKKARQNFEQALLPHLSSIKVEINKIFKEACSSETKNLLEELKSKGIVELKLPNQERFVTQEAYVCAIVHVICQRFGRDLRKDILNEGGLDTVVDNILSRNKKGYFGGFYNNWTSPTSSNSSDVVIIRFKDVGEIAFYGLKEIAYRFILKKPTCITEYCFIKMFSGEKVSFSAAQFNASPLGEYLDLEFYRRLVFEEAYARSYSLNRTQLRCISIEKVGILSKIVEIRFSTGDKFRSAELYNYFFPS